MNAQVDALIAGASSWHDEYGKLREIVSEFPLIEEFKWGWPCYSLETGNVVLIHGFKDYCALLFMKGALLDDPHGILIQQTKNVQAARQIRFANLADIVAREPQVKAVIAQAIEVEKAGQKVRLKTVGDFSIPSEFQGRLDADPALQAAFRGLTPGRQRAYLFYFSAPKQAKTREARIEKCLPSILAGKGLDD